VTVQRNRASPLNRLLGESVWLLVGRDSAMPGMYSPEVSRHSTGREYRRRRYEHTTCYESHSEIADGQIDDDEPAP
jgi:hypothetical protein